MVKKLLLSMLLLPLFVGCKNQVSQTETYSYEFIGDTVLIADNSILNNKIKTINVNEQNYSREVVTAGTVEAIPNQFAYIAPPLSGRVVKSYIRLGQKVDKNTPLFEIFSPDFTEAQKEFFQARAEKELAEKDFKRKEDLLNKGVGSQREFEEAQHSLALAEKEYENAYAALEVFQVNPLNMKLGQPLIVRSPIKGEVIDNNIITGQYINEDSDPVAIVADLTSVWITAQVKEKDIRFIHEGDEMNINISALPGQTIKGEVFHIEEMIDEETRSIKVLSICDNEEGLLKLGMFATVRFVDEPFDVLVIPEKALLQDEDNCYVFAQVAPAKYIKKNIEVENTREGKAIIGKGLTKEDIIICDGGFYLK